MTASAAGQVLPVVPEDQTQHYMNLILSKQSLRDSNALLMTGNGKAEEKNAGHLPYGAGYESRQQGSVSGEGRRSSGEQGGKGRGR